MICIYSKDNTNYSKNGDAVLIPTSCYVSMTINGAWSLTLEHPYDPEERYKYIVEGAVIRVDLKCITELSTIQQRFRIYQYTKNMHSVSCIAFPIAMESTYDSPIDNLVITNKTGVEAMALLQAYSEKYTLSTNITVQKSTSFANTNINNAIASGDDNCFISVWGGEILYDNLNYSVKSSLGNSNSGLQIRYGRNLSAIERQTDDSGLTTRIKPISKDGIRLNGTGYVDSPKISDYPIIHTRYMTAPYNLIEDDVSSNSATAVATRSAQSAVSSAVSSTSGTSYSTALGAGYQPEYIKTIKDDIISAVQTMALSNVISTSLYNYLSKTIASAMSWMGSLEQPAWDWMGSYESGWRYGNENGYAVNQYVRIGKKWSYFGGNGYWQEPADDTDDWDWYQVAGEEGKKYGNFKKYFAHNTYVYITMDGTLTKYWFDSDGWYDSDKTDESDWSWQGSGTAEDPYWFGDPDAEGDEKKYAHSTWLFIDGTYYFFDEFGYYDGSTKFDNYQWDWVESGENFWFGNAEDDTFGAVYVTNQWLKINGSWYYFDSNGYVVSENSSKSAAIAIFTSGMSSVQTTVDTQASALYTVLYNLMTAYANKQYAEGVDVPAITITVNMVDLSKTTEYEGYSALETVKLGDSVEVKDDEHDISLSSRVIGLTYDCLRGYNSEVVIGQPASSVSEILGNAGGTPVAGGFDTSAIEAQIEALQDKVGDIFLNDLSIVSNGVGRFGILSGSNISISRSGNTLTINGEGGNKVYAGTSTPSASIGAEDDLYLQLGVKTEDILALENFHTNNQGTHVLTITDWVKTDRTHYAFAINGNPDVQGHGEVAYFLLDGLVDGNTYHLEFDGQFNSGATFPWSYVDCVCINNYSGRFIEFQKNSNLNHYSGNFTYHDGDYLIFNYPAINDGVNFTFTITNLAITGSFVGGIDEIYGKVDSKWQKYEGGETYNDFVGTDGTSDGASGLVPAPTTADVDKVLKSDGTWGDASAVEANPSETATDTLTKLGIDGTVYEIQGGGGGSIDGSSMSVKTANWVATYSGNVGTTLTDELTLEAGEYLILVNMPYSTDNSFGVFGLNKNGVTLNKAIKAYVSYGFSSVEITLTETSTIKLVSGQATAMSWNSQYLARGGMTAIRLSMLMPIIYSTKEREVGVWIDNKPLYAKVVDFGGTVQLRTSGTNIASYLPSDIEMIVEGVLFNTEYRYEYHVLLQHYNNQVVAYPEQNLEGRYIYILYTKTTDVAGSGSYNTLGVPTVHYSTDEQVIGTWIDGKPLYQKTIHKINTQSSFGDFVTIEEIQNLDTAVESVFMAKRNNGQGNIWYYSGNGATYPESVQYGGYKIAVRISGVNLQYYIAGYGTEITDLFITIRYTKTTD